MIKDLGAFSVSLSVKDIITSKEFYEKLGFEMCGGDLNQKWAIMRNKTTVIGIFEGMFEGNILTFNPGWDNDASELSEFTDVRVLESELKGEGVNFISEVDKESTAGPASFMITDPDGNVILFDQHR